VNGWQPIETAPKDGTEIWLCFGSNVMSGQWDDQCYAKKPNPFWRGVKDYMGVKWFRANQPKCWMPLPPPPDEQEGDVDVKNIET